ncbi:DUF1684 domain-containing protein [Catalinimonas alkaloidigena]|nr:DUF1684 domain-containing protein [Catalinimonas alkaloidigena]
MFWLLLGGAEALWAQSDFATELAAHRQEKNKEFKRSSESPLARADKRAFQGLFYFPGDSSYRVVARLERTPDAQPFQMRTSTDRLPTYVEWGKAHFTLRDTALVLTIYFSPDIAQRPGYEKYLFLPFTDQTSGGETYGGGRYLDLSMPADESSALVLDFNRAYNPYCAYSDRYSCPIPPAVNRLPIRIEAGEKTFREH